MASLAEIESLLNIEIGDKRLKDGKKKANKNRYYYYEQSYYIVELTQGKWMICEDCRTTRKLLRKHYWSVSHGYAMTNFNRSTKKSWHQLYLKYEKGLVTDHINNKRFDNRHDNLRIVTYQMNNRNRSKQTNNTSGKQGVYRCTTSGYRYWRVQIIDNRGKRISKLFSIKKFGDDEAYRIACEWREQKEQELGYIGD